MFSSSNNIFTVKGRVPEENYPPISKPLFRGAGGALELIPACIGQEAGVNPGHMWALECFRFTCFVVRAYIQTKNSSQPVGFQGTPVITKSV